mmetsp:Transcript_59848/g.106404  ORF Transcript_59848/g.106404 Transcript_59848/m.106404 type:complete len:390 (-) Transcript_59848:100-1269(-)
MASSDEQQASEPELRHISEVLLQCDIESLTSSQLEPKEASAREDTGSDTSPSKAWNSLQDLVKVGQQTLKEAHRELVERVEADMVEAGWNNAELAARWQTVVEPVATAVAELLGSDERGPEQSHQGLESFARGLQTDDRRRAEVLASTSTARPSNVTLTSASAADYSTKEQPELHQGHKVQVDTAETLGSSKTLADEGNSSETSEEIQQKAVQAQGRFNSLASTASDTEALAGRLNSLSSFNASDSCPTRPASAEFEPEEIDLDSAPANSSPPTPTAEKSALKSQCPEVCAVSCFQEIVERPKDSTDVVEGGLPVVPMQANGLRGLPGFTHCSSCCAPQETGTPEVEATKDRAATILPPPELQADCIELQSCCAPPSTCKPFSCSSWFV